MASSREAGEGELSVWRLGTLPAVMLMGVTLPCIFLVRIEQYLYYLRPIELLPTYATAWVLLVALSVPIALAGTAALGLTRLGTLHGSRSLVISLLLWAAAVAVLIALILAGLAWMQTFESIR